MSEFLIAQHLLLLRKPIQIRAEMFLLGQCVACLFVAFNLPVLSKLFASSTDKLNILTCLCLSILLYHPYY